MKRTLTLANGVFATLLLASCGKNGGADPSAPKADAARNPSAREVRVVRAEQRTLERILQAVGTLAAREEASVAAQVAGQLEQNLVDLGDRVAAGQELALIDTTAYEALAKASAANLARAEASAANAAQNLRRIQELHQSQIASISDLDAAVAEAARTRAEVKAAEANHAVARLNLERSRVKAPFPGVVAERVASAGDYLGVGTPILRLVQTDPLRLRLEVAERESVAIEVGLPVRFSVEGETQVYQTKLARVAPAIRAGSRMLLVESDVPNPGGLRAGLFARAQIVVREPTAVVVVPQEALITFAGVEKVVLFEAGKALERTVTTGRHEGGWVEIVSGLTAGEKVVLAPAGIRTGQPLRVANSSPSPVAVPSAAAR
jgi:RND family efflux transporter MFP subunit